MANKEARKFIRFFLAGAANVEFDKQGRILITQRLREYAHVDKDIIVIGASYRAEIWNKERWEASCNELTSDALSEIMAELGF